MEDDKGRTAALPGWLEESSEAAERLRERDDAALEAAGFERVEASVWVKEGVCYGREAALQNAARSRPGLF